MHDGSRFPTALLGAILALCAAGCARHTVLVRNKHPYPVEVKVVVAPAAKGQSKDKWTHVPAGEERPVKLPRHFARSWDSGNAIRHLRVIVAKGRQVQQAFEMCDPRVRSYSMLGEPHHLKVRRWYSSELLNDPPFADKTVYGPIVVSAESSLDWKDLTVTNNTSAPIRFIRDEFPLAVIPAGKTRAIELAVPLYEGRPVRITAIPEGVALWRLSQGNIPFDGTFSHGELEAAGWHIVIPAEGSAEIAD